MTTTRRPATTADHEAYGSVTWLVAMESAEENWADHNGRLAETDAEMAEVADWARGYITSGLTEVYEGDNLDLIAGSATPTTPSHATEEPTMTATAPTEITTAQRAALTWVETRDGQRPSTGTLRLLVTRGWITEATREGHLTAAGRALLGLAAARPAQGPSPEAVAAATAALQAELTANADAIGRILSEPLPGEAVVIVDGEKERASLPAGAVVRHVIVDGDQRVPFASRSRATRMFEQVAATGRPVQWLSAKGSVVREANATA